MKTIGPAPEDLTGTHNSPLDSMAPGILPPTARMDRQRAKKKQPAEADQLSQAIS